MITYICDGELKTVAGGSPALTPSVKTIVTVSNRGIGFNGVAIVRPGVVLIW